eukprot:GILI01014984.1.p1 GENE.GILI01014984.1~~GILI01014984.1.p1  ORF type:complete len:194 (-),score=55.78 GILI01014984.1:303-884(-)
MASREALAALDKLKRALEKRGSRTIAALGRTFRALDSFDGNKKVDREEFVVGLRENGVTLNDAEFSALIEYFDKNGDGYIDFDEFLVGVRGALNSRRQAIVDKAFLKMDKNANGIIEVDDLEGVFNARGHPKVKSGEWTERQALGDFLKNFNDRNGDGVISREEWNEYFAAISANIDNDDHFILLMKNAWKLT